MFSFGEYQGILDFSLRDAVHKRSMWCPSVWPLGRLSNSAASLSVRPSPSCIVSKRLNSLWKFFHRLIASIF